MNRYSNLNLLASITSNRSFEIIIVSNLPSKTIMFVPLSLYQIPNLPHWNGESSLKVSISIVEMMLAVKLIDIVDNSIYFHGLSARFLLRNITIAT